MGTNPSKKRNNQQKSQQKSRQNELNTGALINDEQELHLLISGYLNNINQSCNVIVPMEIIDTVFKFYGLHIFLNQKALSVYSTQKLKKAMQFLANKYNICCDGKGKSVNKCHPNGLKLMTDFLYFNHTCINGLELVDFITRPESSVLTKEQHKQLLYSYLRYYPFGKFSVFTAMRKLFTQIGIQCPREAQKIGRLMRAFADIYVETTSRNDLNADGIILLTYRYLISMRCGSCSISLDAFRMCYCNSRLPPGVVDEFWKEKQERPFFC